MCNVFTCDLQNRMETFPVDLCHLISEIISQRATFAWRNLAIETHAALKGSHVAERWGHIIKCLPNQHTLMTFEWTAMHILKWEFHFRPRTHETHVGAVELDDDKSSTPTSIESLHPTQYTRCVYETARGMYM